MREFVVPDEEFLRPWSVKFVEVEQTAEIFVDVILNLSILLVMSYHLMLDYVTCHA